MSKNQPAKTPKTPPLASETTGDASPVQQVTRLEHARNLPEVGADAATQPASEAMTAFQSFKGEDRRTMNVVVFDGALAQQEAYSANQ